MVARRAARGRAATGASHARLMPFQRSMIYMGSIAGMTMSDIAGKVQKSDGSDSARPTLDKINLKNRQHAPAKSARPFNVECAPFNVGARGDGLGGSWSEDP